MKKYLQQNGFTLIELMVTTLIVAILAALAYPSYMSSVRKSNRSDAKTELTDVAQQLQRCYTSYSKFNDANNCGVYIALTTGAQKITSLSRYYDVTLDANPAISASTFRLVATAVKAPQTEDKPGGTDCTVLKLDQTGTRTPLDCW